MFRAIRLFVVLAAMLAWPVAAEEAAVLAPDRQAALESVLALLLQERGASLSPATESRINAIRFLSFQGGLDPGHLRIAPDALWFDVPPDKPVKLRLGLPYQSEIELVSGSVGVRGGAVATDKARLTWDGALYESEGGQWLRVWRSLAVVIPDAEAAMRRLGVSPAELAPILKQVAEASAKGENYLGLFHKLVLENGGAGDARNSDFAVFSTVMCELRDGVCPLPALIGLVGAPF